MQDVCFITNIENVFDDGDSSFKFFQNSSIFPYQSYLNILYRMNFIFRIIFGEKTIIIAHNSSESLFSPIPLH